ncbi:MAG TPA: hypothetical protein VFB63_00755 [Bryobacteraceae bacterium]|jgi:hypothetical protein|nr:hypothetical protein [Bryobacteraceae bacterium]
MSLGARYLRGWLETTAVASAMGVGTIVYAVWSSWTGVRSGTLLLLLMVVSYPIPLLVSSMLALRGWKKGRKGWAYATAVLQLPLFPIGSVPGFAALLLLPRTDPAIQSPQAKPCKVKGDGTGWFANVLASVVWIGAIGAMILTNRWAGDRGLHSPGFLVWLALFAASAHINMLVHECGHCALGWMVRFRLYRFDVDPFSLYKTEGRWKFEVRKPSFSGAARCGMAPESLENLRWRTAIFTLGGPLASLGFGAACTAMFIMSPQAGWTNTWVFFQTAGVIGLAHFVVNLIPIADRQHYSDGAGLYQLWRGGGWADHLLARSLATMSLHSSLRPRDWDTAVMERAAAFESTPYDTSIVLLLTYLMYVDRGELERGAPHYRRAKELLEGLDGRALEVFAMEMTLHEALIHGNAAEARRWFNRGRKGGEFECKLAEAALFWCEGDARMASRSLEEAAVLLRKLPPVGAYAVERDWLEAVQRALATQLASSAASG